MPDNRPLTAVILAAGIGTRMRSRMAKPLHPLCGRTMVGWMLHAVAGLEPERVVVVVGHQADEVMRAIEHDAPAGLKVIPVLQREQLGTGHALATALAGAETTDDEDVLVVAVDHPLLDTETLASLVLVHRETGSPWTLVSAEVEDPTGYGRVVRNDDGFVDCIVEERDCGPEEAAITSISTVMYCLKREVVEPLLFDLEPENDAGELYLNSVIDALDGVVAVEADPEVVAQVNDRVHLAAAESILRRRINERLMISGVTMIDPVRTYVDVDVAIGSDTILYPGVYLEGATIVGQNCSIGPDVRMIDSEVGDGVVVRMAHIVDASIGNSVSIGPYASLRGDCHILDGAHLGTYVEIKRSTIGEGSKVPHLAYVGDATIGKDVNWSAGAITCNFDGVTKNETIVGDGAFIGSDSLLLAPVIVGEHAHTASGSLINRDVPAHALAKGIPSRIEEGGADRVRRERRERREKGGETR